MSCLPLAKVVEEPHAAANICGVVHSILDGVTKRAGKRRVEIVLVDATARVTCVFWEAWAAATARGVARLDVVTVDVHHATKRGDGSVVCDCRSAARVRWRHGASGGALSSVSVRRAVAWAKAEYESAYAALEAAAAAPPEPPPPPPPSPGSEAISAIGVAEAKRVLARGPVDAIYVSAALERLTGPPGLERLGDDTIARAALAEIPPTLVARIGDGSGDALDCAVSPDLARVFLGCEPPSVLDDDPAAAARVAARYRAVAATTSSAPRVLVLRRASPGDEPPLLLRVALLQGGDEVT